MFEISAAILPILPTISPISKKLRISQLFMSSLVSCNDLLRLSAINTAIPNTTLANAAVVCPNANANLSKNVPAVRATKPSPNIISRDSLIPISDFFSCSIPSSLKVSFQPRLNKFFKCSRKANKGLSFSRSPSNIVLYCVPLSEIAISGKISLPPAPLPLPPLPPPPPPEPPESSSESSFFLFNRLISSNPIKPRNSFTAFLAALPAFPTLSARLPAPPPASSKLSAKSPAAFPAPCKPWVALFTAPATPSVLLTFLSNSN